jgi:hypothetical protein
MRGCATLGPSDGKRAAPRRTEILASGRNPAEGGTRSPGSGAPPPRRVRRLTDLRLSRRLVSVVESSRTSPARQLGHRRSLRSNYPHALRFYRSDAPEKLRISGLRGKRLRRKASERQSHDERSASHTDDREISDTVERIKVLILCYDRQVLRGSDRRDPQIVDPDAATRLGEMDAQQCPQSGRFLVHR